MANTFQLPARPDGGDSPEGSNTAMINMKKLAKDPAEMTQEEINAACCEFLGISKENTDQWVAYGDGNLRACVQRYPPVSTDRDMIGRLMDALAAKGIDYQLAHHPVRRPGHQHHATLGHEEASAVSTTGPMALALAVVQLAQAAEAK
jgi:hypothetical protein